MTRYSDHFNTHINNANETAAEHGAKSFTTSSGVGAAVPDIVWTGVTNTTELEAALDSGKLSIYLEAGADYELTEELVPYNGLTLRGESLPTDATNTGSDGVHLTLSTGGNVISKSISPSSESGLTVTTPVRGDSKLEVTAGATTTIPAGSLIFLDDFVYLVTADAVPAGGAVDIYIRDGIQHISGALIGFEYILESSVLKNFSMDTICISEKSGGDTILINGFQNMSFNNIAAGHFQSTGAILSHGVDFFARNIHYANSFVFAISIANAMTLENFGESYDDSTFSANDIPSFLASYSLNFTMINSRGCITDINNCVAFEVNNTHSTGPSEDMFRNSHYFSVNGCSNMNTDVGFDCSGSSNFTITGCMAPDATTPIDLGGATNYQVYGNHWQGGGTVYNASSNPSVNNDGVDTAGIGVTFQDGDIWIDNDASAELYACYSNATGAAIWIRHATHNSLTSHTGNTNNPHEVTKDQVGLGNVPNTDYTAHTTSSGNPHSVTAAQIGVESSATADQTGSEIKSLYEAESDTNAFTDTEKTNLETLTDTSNADALHSHTDVGVVDLASLSQTLNVSGTATMTLSSPKMYPMDTVYKEIAGSTSSTNEWDIIANDTGWGFRDQAPSVSVTPSATAGNITLTLSSGAWSSSDLGKRVVGNSGQAVITDQDGTSVADATVITGKDFANTDTITSGNWQEYAGYIDDTGKFTLGDFSVYTSTLTEGIDGFTPEDQDHPRIVIDSNDKLHIVWSGKTPSVSGYDHIHYATNATGSWIVTEDIFTSGNYWQQDPDIAIDSTNLYVVWAGMTATSSGKYLIHHAVTTISGGSWTIDEDIGSIGNYTQQFPSIALDNSGYSYVVWEGESSSEAAKQIHYATNVSASWVSTEDISAVGSYNQNHPRIAIDSVSAGENIHVVYYGMSASYASISAIHYSVYTSSWSTFADISSLPTDTQDRPDITIDTSDNIHVVWSGQTPEVGTRKAISYAKYVSSWTVEENLSTYNVDNQFYPSIITDSNDYAHIAWNGQTPEHGSKTPIHYITNKSGSWVKTADLGGLTSQNQQYPEIILDSNENIIITWQGYDGSNFVYQINVYYITGSSILYVVNEYVACVSTSSQIDTTNWTDINSLTSVETLNGQNMYYVISVDGKTTWQVSDVSGTPRLTASDRNTVTSQGDGTWCYNSNVTYGSETWATVTPNNVHRALEQAASVAASAMTKSEMISAGDSAWPAIGTALDAAMIAYSTSSGTSPTCDSVTVNYDGAITYKKMVLGTDYDLVQLDSLNVRIDSLADNGNVFVKLRG